MAETEVRPVDPQTGNLGQDDRDTIQKRIRSTLLWKNRRSILRKALIAAPVLVAAIICATLLGLSAAYFRMRPVLKAELGEPIPEAAEFAPGRDAAYLAVPETVSKKGWHRLTVSAGGRERAVWLWVRDTKAPAAVGAKRTISTIATLGPDDLIENLEDSDLVKVSFAAEPPFGTAGDWAVTILLEDGSKNRSSVDAELCIRVVNEGITVEAGESTPSIRAFLEDDYPVDSATKITETMLHTPGVYPIEIQIGGERYVSTLTVKDTVAPQAATRMVIKRPEEPVTPDDFLESVVDETTVEKTFLIAPDPTVRTIQQVKIRLTDLGGNETDVTAELLYSHAQATTIEARTTPLNIADCVDVTAYQTARLQKTFVPNRVGLYAVTLLLDGAAELALVEVKDTVAPVLTAEDMVWYVNHPIEPRALCKTLLDVTETVVSTEREIDWSKEGEQRVELIATDAGNNTARATLTLTLRRDEEPPVLYGVIDRNCYVGEPVAYFSEVFAEDALDGTVEVRVDNSAVRASEPGRYPVVYSATDSDGNTREAKCMFTFVDATISDEEIAALAADVMAKITNERMTRTEKLEAIFNYVRSHVKFVNSSDKRDWRKEAERGINTGKGDCFTFYSVTRALLDQTDISYMSLTRKGSSTQHFWVIVNVGTGWYHFDPTLASSHSYRCFMWTNKQCAVKKYFWRYEEANYPAIATEPFRKNEVIEMERAGLLP